jgi:pimeloyl-ACP methyl ester carboxylesterase
VTLARDDAVLEVVDRGAGPAVVFQHGLGGDAAQAAGVFPDGGPWRRITVECRGHGRSTLGSARPFSFGMFADDVLAAAQAAGIGRFVAGGISMGAAIALRLAVRHPERVRALVMVRPAWGFAPAPADLAPLREVAALLATLPPAEARARFAASATARRLAAEAPDNLASLIGYFDRPDPAAFAAVLSDIAGDGPGVGAAELRALALPSLVIGNARDALHPSGLARDLAAAIAGARMLEVTAKADDKARNAEETRVAIDGFLRAVA